jgi:E3 ubiquitin-protein ligase NEDD4
MAAALPGDINSTDLVVDGENIPVTSDNVQEYLDLYTQWRLVGATAEQFSFVSSQIYNQVSLESLSSSFKDASQFGLMMSGKPEIDVVEWKASTVYEEPFNATSQVIAWFW